AHSHLPGLGQWNQFLATLYALVLYQRINDVAVSKPLSAEELSRGEHSHSNIDNRPLLALDGHQCKPVLCGHNAKRMVEARVLICAVIFQQKGADLGVMLASALDGVQRCIHRLSIST